MIQITEMLLKNKLVRPFKNLKKIKGVVVHWTANTSKGADAKANRNYFESIKDSKLTASAHYCVDDKEIVLCVPDVEIAYHVGAKTYTETGKNIMEQIPDSPNNYLIGIEMCVNSDGNFEETRKKTIELIVHLLKKYNLKIENLYRHYDITGKLCPKMLIDEKEWDKFKQEIEQSVSANNALAQEKIYVVQKGDTLYSIAAKKEIYNDRNKYKELISLNELKSNFITIGQKLKY